MKRKIRVRLAVTVVTPKFYIEIRKSSCKVKHECVVDVKCRSYSPIVMDEDFSISQYLVRYINRRTWDLLVLRELQVHRSTDASSFIERTGVKTLRLASGLPSLLDPYVTSGAVTYERATNDKAERDANSEAARNRWAVIKGEAAKRVASEKRLRLFKASAIQCVVERSKVQTVPNNLLAPPPGQ